MTGKLIKYTKNGITQKAMMLDADQLPEFSAGRVFVRLVNDDLTPKIDEETGKKLFSLVWDNEITVVEFID